MHKLTTPAAVAAALVAMFAAPAAIASDYEQAPGSALSFASQYDGVTFTGRFPEFETHLHFDPDDLASAHLDVSIALASAITGNRDRDSTLKTADFFNITQFARARYSAAHFRALGDNQYAADGTLELKGIEKPVTLTFTWTPASAGVPAILTGSATLKRLEFNIGSGDWKNTGTIPDEVAIATKVRLRRAGEQ